MPDLPVAAQRNLLWAYLRLASNAVWNDAFYYGREHGLARTRARLRLYIGVPD